MVTERQTGTVAKWLNHKGIGFITPDGAEEVEGEKKDILVHFQQIKQSSDDGFRSLRQGATVEFELREDEKNPDKMVAVNVTGPDGADCEARVKGEGKRGSKGKGKGKRSRGKGKGKGKRGKGKRGKGKKSDESDDEAEEE